MIGIGPENFEKIIGCKIKKNIKKGQQINFKYIKKKNL